MALLGNCDIQVEQKILVVNKTKQNKIWSKKKFFAIKNFCNLLPNFIEGLNKNWLKFRPFFMDESEWNDEWSQGLICAQKAPFSTNHDTFNEISAESLAKFCTLFQWYDKKFMVFNEISWHITKSHNIKLWLHPVLWHFVNLYGSDDFKSLQ